MLQTMLKTIFNLMTLGMLLLLSSTVFAADSSLSDALPSTELLAKKEECSKKQHSMMSSLGLGDTACTLSKYVSFDSISKAVGISAFQTNSRNNPLDPSDNVEEFVRYSPDFFTRVNDLYSKDSDNAVYGFFYKHFLTNSTRLFYMAGKNFRDNTKPSTVTLAQYKKAVNNSKPLNISAAAQCKNSQASIVKTYGVTYNYKETFSQCGKSGNATLFWYRRQLDGSSDALFTLLDNVLKTQDEQFYSQLKLAVKTGAQKTAAAH